MSATNATNARKNLFRLIEQVNADHEPVIISGKRGSAVLIGEDDWRAIEETIHLNSVPGIAESIREGLDTPTGRLYDDVEW